MPASWGAKRERQYDEVKRTELDRGRGLKEAKRIAAATVNKTRARKGEIKGAKHAKKKTGKKKDD